MKKLLLFGVAAIVVVSVSVFAYHRNTSVFLISSDVEALTMTECIISSGTNNGHCEAALNGSGDVCVDPHWWQSKNCITHQ